MFLICKNHDYLFEMENIVRIFFPMEKIVTLEEDLPDTDGMFSTILTKTDGGADLFAKAVLHNQTATATRFATDAQLLCADGEWLMASALCECLTELTGYKPPWGLMTGVRPSKLMRSYIEQFGVEKAIDRFVNFLEVSPAKAQLAVSVAEAEDAVVALSDENSVSQYASVPFCPSRCSYCSFVSHSVKQAAKLIPDYTALLCREITENARIADELGLQTLSFYIGGGTPTSLTAEQLKEITDAVKNAIDLAKVREYTVEAGRPDTITREKLQVLFDAGVTRISVNPQTFNDNVLSLIGRKHTVADFYSAFNTAREIGFDNINMDLIAGLPGDSPDSFADSIRQAIALDPENITVHTLALKRSSELVTEHEWHKAAKDTVQMLDTASELLTAAGYKPYYMYRQSKCIGNLENVGWCKPGKECIYNVYMMEEVHTVLASGGGAVTKLKDPHSAKIERIFNFKYPYEYVSRFDELLARKDRIASFYGEVRI
ncbi:MAG: coproporphyrinogen dehydrogenase HemZ [Clostridia bacterium]|nr:coproporphyrinogen dehydrogenase HemZ [Clostridia bacterium]